MISMQMYYLILPSESNVDTVEVADSFLRSRGGGDPAFSGLLYKFLF